MFIFAVLELGVWLSSRSYTWL